jgi:hypothetical protein
LKRFALASLVVMVLAVLRGLQLPLLWTSTHYLFTYDEGFAKRGLFGQFLAFLLGDARYHYQTLATVAFVVLALLLLVITVVGIRQRNPYYLIFLGGPAGAYLFQEVGYLDQVVYLLAVAGALAALRFPRWRLPLTLLPGLVSLFVHEGALFTTCPLLVFAALLVGRPRDLVAFLAFPLAAVAISEWGLLSPQAATAMMQRAAQHADFPIRTDAYAVFSRMARDNTALVLDRWAKGQMLFRLYDVLPYCTLFTAVSLFGLRSLFPSLAVSAGAVVVTLAPLVLSILGWDLDRWGALVMLNAFLCLMLVAQALKASPKLPAAIVVVAVIVGAFARYPFMIGHPERLPPYTGFGEFTRPTG